MKSCSIKGLGYALAERRVTNGELSTFVDVNDEWISNRTGICVRYISEGKNTSDPDARTVRMVVNKSDIDPREINLIIIATFTPGQITPSMACLIQGKLGLDNQHMMTLDLDATCSGFLYTSQSAHAMLATGQMTCALVIGTEVISKQLDWNDRPICIIFANGTGATIMGQENTNKRTLYFAGSMGDAAGVTCNDAPKPKPLFLGRPYQPSMVCMEGNAALRFAVKAMQEIIEDVLKQAGEHVEDINWIAPHWANMRIINNVCKHIHIDKEYVCINIEEYGNTSVASIPLALGEVSEGGLLQPGIRVVLSGFGADFTWAGCYIELQGELYINK